MHGRFRQLEMYHFSTMGRQFLRSNKGITLFLFSVVSCFSAVDLLSSGLCHFSMWTSCLSMCHTDLQHVVCALDAILLQQDGKHHSKLPASYLSDGKIKANQNKICAPQLLSWSMAGPPEGEWLSLNFVIRPHYHWSLPSALLLMRVFTFPRDLSRGSLLPFLSWSSVLPHNNTIKQISCLQSFMTSVYFVFMVDNFMASKGTLVTEVNDSFQRYLPEHRI